MIGIEMKDLTRLEPFGEDGSVRMVVETPRGASVKLAYDPDLQAFSVRRALSLGVTYPFDWGFIPGTVAEDGDPLDALALHDSSTYPGVILPCRPLGVADVTQQGEHGLEKNPRLILMPIWHDRLGEYERATALPERLKGEIERFFVNATLFTGKDPRIEGWRGPEAATKLIQTKRRSLRHGSKLRRGGVV
jgi:inorganic pyrophosphatase